MSRLLVLTRPDLVAGFQLAGVNAYSTETAEAAQDLIRTWLDAGETGLMAIDDGLLEYMEPNFLRHLQSSEKLLYLSIPGGQPLGAQASQRHRIAAMIRQAIGFHITFKGEEVEDET